MAQEIINTGTTANDGTGDPLRTAFIKTDSNFDQIWAAGPVGTNVQISGNTISTVQVNQDLVLAPNGVANVRINNNTVPNANNIWYLGSVTNQWRGLYVGNVVAGNISISNGLVVPGDASIGGNLTVEGDVIQIGNIVTDSKTIQLANTAATDAQANGSGITVVPTMTWLPCFTTALTTNGVPTSAPTFQAMSQHLILSVMVACSLASLVMATPTWLHTCLPTPVT